MCIKKTNIPFIQQALEIISINVVKVLLINIKLMQKLKAIIPKLIYLP
jgi:hypothetical protein